MIAVMLGYLDICCIRLLAKHPFHDSMPRSRKAPVLFEEHRSFLRSFFRFDARRTFLARDCRGGTLLYILHHTAPQHIK
jgi:hypothetical protein